MNILLSIKPKYVNEIVNGNKKYEFRRRIFRSRDIDKIYIYSSFPVRKIIGLFVMGEIIEDSPLNLWANYKACSGMRRGDFFSYFSGKEKGFAIEIRDLDLFDVPIDPKMHLPDFLPPQSFSYFSYPIAEIVAFFERRFP